MVRINFLLDFTACIVLDWSFVLHVGKYFELAAYYRALVVFLGTVWSPGWAVFFVLFGCALEFGMPGEIRRMILHMRMLLVVSRILSLPDKNSGDAAPSC